MAGFSCSRGAGAALGRRFAAAVALSLVLGLVAAASGALSGAWANENGNDNSERRDTKSRNEPKLLTSIPLVSGGGSFRIDRIILIEARVVEVAETSFGIDFDNLDRVDVSDVPLFGSFFDAPLKAVDLTDANRIGTVFGGDDGALVAVLGDVTLRGVKLSVVNGKGRYDFVQGPRILETPPTDLGDLGTLPSVQSVIAGTAPQGTTLVLGGLTETSVPPAAGNQTVLGDIPVLQSLFRGTVHQRDNDELILFIRPSVIAGDEEE